MSFYMHVLPPADGHIPETRVQAANVDDGAVFASLLDAVLAENTASTKLAAVSSAPIENSACRKARQEEALYVSAMPALQACLYPVVALAVPENKPEPLEPSCISPQLHPIFVPFTDHMGPTLREIRTRPVAEVASMASGFKAHEVKEGISYVSDGLLRLESPQAAEIPASPERFQSPWQNAFSAQGMKFFSGEAYEAKNPEPVLPKPLSAEDVPKPAAQGWEGSLLHRDFPDRAEPLQRPDEPLGPMQQMIRAEGFGQLNETRTLMIRLKPETLGTVLIKLAARDGRMEARILAANPLARALLMEELPMLEQALREQELNLDSLEVLPFEESPSSFSESGHPDGQPRQPQQGAPAQNQEQEPLPAQTTQKFPIPDRRSIDCSV